MPQSNEGATLASGEEIVTNIPPWLCDRTQCLCANSGVWRNSVALWRTSATLWSCDTLSVVSVDSALLVERHVAEWLRAQAIVPGVELHDDPDITWVVHPGRAWSNAAS